MTRSQGPLSAAVDRPKNAMQTLRRLLTFTQHVRGWFYFAMVISIISSLAQLAVPYLIGQIIDSISLTANASVVNINQAILWLIGYTVLSITLQYVNSMLMIHLAQRVIVKMREAVFTKYSSLAISYFDRYQVGDMLSRISYDIDTINTSLSADVIVLFASTVTVFSALVLMIGISLPLMSVFIITLPLSIMISRKLARVTRPLFRTRSARLGDMNGYIEETISGIKTIKAYAVESSFIKGFDEKNEAASQAYYEADYWGSIAGPAINFINNISLTLITLFGALLLLFRITSIGQISAFILVSRRFSAPISEASNMFAELQSTLAAAERVFKVLDEPGEVETGDVILSKQLAGTVDFEQVVFRYDDNKTVIKA